MATRWTLVRSHLPGWPPLTNVARAPHAWTHTQDDIGMSFLSREVSSWLLSRKPPPTLRLLLQNIISQAVVVRCRQDETMGKGAAWGGIDIRIAGVGDTV